MNSNTKKYIKLLSKYLKQSRLKIAGLALVMGISIAIQLINPTIVSYFIDGVQSKKAVKDLIIAAIVFIIAAFAQQLLALLSTYLSQNIGWSATNALRLDLIKHCIGLDMTFFKEHQSGELVERIDGDVNALFNFFSQLLISLINNGLLVAGIVVILAFQNIIIGLAFAVFLVFSFIAIWKAQGEAVGNFKKNREITAKFYGFLGEHIGSTEDIRANGAKKYVMNKFYALLQKWLPIALKANLSGYRIWMTLEVVFGIGDAAVFALGGILWYKGKISLGIVYLMVNYIQLLEKPLGQLRNQLQDMQKSTASIVRIEELFNTKSKLQDGTEENIFDVLDLKVKNVDFQYVEDTPVLNDVSFHLKHGKILGVLGRTGSGKTTLSRLLVRFYDVNSGNIYINDKDLKTLSIRALRKNIAYVTQDVQLFNASVRDNITFFNENIKDETILNTIYDMGLEEWYEKLGDGLDTTVNPGGTGMSSGEAQLLSLVRVFLKAPKLIILDEASSRLDPVTEKLVDKALNKLIEGRSCIIIAHRLATIERADDILILQNGSVLEYGNRKGLIEKKDSKFNELLKYGMEEVMA
ncbi:ABC transporter ATP-binding protein [Clostridium sp. 19966]|uniref:ABC transporter ATP-binding protein n=1 Tax=Clostridium sp. 19966 TaxID=2768166 RepID=UPI0028DFB722|nr:ABC transporter ATP-binding protein [Clostridium sp. 19966]MDT8718340.1 ABC transporter ATP-binding protein [Clostridium sp. 19966]